MKKKRIVIALGHDALGTTLPEQQAAAKKDGKSNRRFCERGLSDHYFTQQRTTGWNDPYGNVRILQNISGVYGNTNVCLLCHESGIYRI